MVSTFTPNIQLEEPARGDYVGIWDTPVNANMTLIDLVVGGGTTISGAAGSVVLAAAQFQCKTITFNSTLLASITITFPTSFTKSYEIRNICTGSSAFVITLQSTVAASQVVCAPPGETVEIMNLGGNILFKNLGRIGGYWDYAGSSVPAWVSGCSVPPYLACTAVTFSSATYPTLATILGSTTTPDLRGRYRAALNEGTGRLTSAGAGVDGNTIFAVGSGNGVTLSASHIPSGVTATNAAQSITVTSTTYVANNPFGNSGSAVGGGTQVTVSDPGSGGRLTQIPATGSNSISVTTVNSSQGTFPNAPPTLVGGITMIRAG